MSSSLGSMNQQQYLQMASKDVGCIKKDLINKIGQSNFFLEEVLKLFGIMNDVYSSSEKSTLNSFNFSINNKGSSNFKIPYIAKRLFMTEDSFKKELGVNNKSEYISFDQMYNNNFIKYRVNKLLGELSNLFTDDRNDLVEIFNKSIGGGDNVLVKELSGHNIIIIDIKDGVSNISIANKELGCGCKGVVYAVTDVFNSCSKNVLKVAKNVDGVIDIKNELRILEKLDGGHGIQKKPRLVYFKAHTGMEKVGYLAHRYQGDLERGPNPHEPAKNLNGLLQLSLSLKHMQDKGVAHLDVKSDNVFVDDNGFCLADFGLAMTKDDIKDILSSGKGYGKIRDDIWKRGAISKNRYQNKDRINFKGAFYKIFYDKELTIDEKANKIFILRHKTDVCCMVPIFERILNDTNWPKGFEPVKSGIMGIVDKMNNNSFDNRLTGEGVVAKIKAVIDSHPEAENLLKNVDGFQDTLNKIIGD